MRVIDPSSTCFVAVVCPQPGRLLVTPYIVTIQLWGLQYRSIWTLGINRLCRAL